MKSETRKMYLVHIYSVAGTEMDQRKILCESAEIAEKEACRSFLEEWRYDGDLHFETEELE